MRYVDVNKLINALSGTISVRQLDMIKAAIFNVGVVGIEELTPTVPLQKLQKSCKSCKKTTDDEIIKALEYCCGNKEGECDEVCYQLIKEMAEEKE